MKNRIDFQKIDLRLVVAVALVVLSIASRFIADVNFTPIMAVALFSGAMFSNRKLALLVPFLALFISDLFIGLHSTMIAVYVSFAAIVFLGMKMKAVSFKNVLGNSILGAVIFFFVTNFGVWLAGWYGHTLAGLATCFELAIPFFRNTLASSVLYSGLLFGGFYLAEKFAFESKKEAKEII
jgi:hypothetical protein